jgi:hypothetical protein
MTAMTYVLLAVIVALALLGPHFGVDSHDGRDWQECR